MPYNILFILIFLCQMILLSYYLPGKIYKRVRYIFDTYPPSDFPKLYPKPIEVYRLYVKIFWGMNLTILVSGLAILVALLAYSPDLSASNPERWDQALVTAWFFIQFCPMLLMEISVFKYYQRMREANSGTRRKAALQPRRLFDFVSPAMLGTAISVYIAFVLFIIYMRQFDYPWFGGYGNIVGITAINLLFAGIMIWNVYGKKRDPHQANSDRIRQIGFTVKSLVFVSIVATMFVAIEIVLHAVDLRHLNSIVMSLYFQLIAVISIGAGLRTFRIGDLNFEVYKGEPVAT